MSKSRYPSYRGQNGAVVVERAYPSVTSPKTALEGYDHAVVHATGPEGQRIELYVGDAMPYQELDPLRNEILSNYKLSRDIAVLAAVVFPSSMNIMLTIYSLYRKAVSIIKEIFNS